MNRKGECPCDAYPLCLLRRKSKQMPAIYPRVVVVGRLIVCWPNTDSAHVDRSQKKTIVALFSRNERKHKRLQIKS